ncbi:MAG: PD-(D/E)XK nuclease family protein [Candidatus Korobacteraceae bacterium]
MIRDYRAAAELGDVQARGCFPQIRGLLEKFKNCRDAWQQKQIGVADDFDIFETIGVSWKEACHSNLLAWLLDHRIEWYGTHAQGNLGLRCFLHVLGAELCLRETYADAENYWVRREQSGSESRIDVEVAARKLFIIHIENKIGADEGPIQLKNECDDLQSRRRELEIPEPNCHAVFLTLDGKKPSHPEFKPLAWYQIADVFDVFGRRSCAPDVGVFAKHYAAALRRLAVVPSCHWALEKIPPVGASKDTRERGFGLDG